MDWGAPTRTHEEGLSCSSTQVGTPAWSQTRGPVVCDSQDMCRWTGPLVRWL